MPNPRTPEGTKPSHLTQSNLTYPIIPYAILLQRTLPYPSYPSYTSDPTPHQPTLPRPDSTNATTPYSANHTLPYPLPPIPRCTIIPILSHHPTSPYLLISHFTLQNNSLPYPNLALFSLPYTATSHLSGNKTFRPQNVSSLVVSPLSPTKVVLLHILVLSPPNRLRIAKGRILYVGLGWTVMLLFCRIPFYSILSHNLGRSSGHHR